MRGKGVGLLGDIFVDGNRKFKIIGNDGRYPVSQFIGFVGKDELTEEVKTETVNDIKVEINYEEIPYAELKKECAKRGLSAKGSKPDLINRLKG